jgi:hypothetical protein
MAEPNKSDAERAYVGLCADCVHGRRIQSDRGSVFYLCEQAASDPSYPKYPRLPVIRCDGYQCKPLRQSMAR